MDRDRHELQNYGFCGIYKESFKIIFKWKKIFSQIILALILPLTTIFLAHTLVSQLILYEVKLGPEWFEERPIGGNQKKRLWIAFWSFEVISYVGIVSLSSLSMAAVVCIVACIYAAKDTTFRGIMSAMPRVWKRLIVTFLWNFAVLFLFHVVAGVLLVAWINMDASNEIRISILVIFLVLYIVGFVYITMIWQLASVVSILEDVNGWKAMAKGRKLMKGKKKVTVGCFVGLVIMFLIVVVLYELFVVIGWFILSILALRILVGIICGVLLIMVMLYGLVVPTVLYFVCKAYHHENIDKSSLSQHLEGYLGNFVTLGRDVKL